MHRTARIQAWATLVAALIMPMLYLGGTYDMTPVSAIGLAIFTLSMLTCPLLRFIPARARKDAEVAPKAK